MSAGDDVAAIDNRTFYFLTVDAGFLAQQGVRDDSFAPVASVTGRDDWLITQGGLVARRPSGAMGNAGGAVVAIPDQSVDPRQMGDPFRAGVGRSPDAGHVVVVYSSNDALFSADVTNIYHDPASPPGLAGFRMVVLTRVAIRSLAVMNPVPGDDGGLPYAHAYALAREELFEINAPSEAVWRAKPVTVPGGQLLEVWSDGEHARLGFSDGTVRSLPSLKLLAPPLPVAVVDYLQFRGEPWALSAGGLWRLNAPAPDAGFTGTWEQGPAAWSPDAGVDFTGGAMFEANDALYLFTKTGFVYRVK